MAAAPVEVKKTTPSTVPARTPDVLRSLRTDMDRLFDRFSASFGLPTFSRMFEGPSMAFESSFTLPAPAMDIAEDAAGYKITAELPGMTEKDVEVTLSGETLTVKGEKKQETEKKDANYHLSERSWGTFQRSFVLPEGVDPEKIVADFAKGVLTLTLPKKPQAVQQARKIDVKAAA
jgi:HSP20 family protein